MPSSIGFHIFSAESPAASHSRQGVSKFGQPQPCLAVNCPAMGHFCPSARPSAPPCTALVYRALPLFIALGGHLHALITVLPSVHQHFASASKTLYVSLWAHFRGGLASKPACSPRRSCTSFCVFLCTVFVWEILPINDLASVIFPPVFGEGELRIADPPRQFPHSSME